MRNKKVKLIGIAGASGSGKTTFLSKMVNLLYDDSFTIIETDFYYKDLESLPLAVRNEVNFDHPDSIDMDLLYAHLQALMSGNSVEQPQYDFSTHTRKTGTSHIKSRRLIFLDGILSFVDRRIRSLLHAKIFIECDLNTCLQRRLRRDIKERGRSWESIVKQYNSSVLPMYYKYIEPSKQHADIIISGDGSPDDKINLILNKLCIPNELLKDMRERL